MFPPDFTSIERRRLRILSILFLLALTLPYAWAWLLTPIDGVYSGYLYNPDDQNVHLSWARQARDGAFFFRDVFTTEGLASGERALFTNVLAWGIGVVSRLTTLPLIVVYHVFRLVFAILALWWFAALCAHLTSDKRVRLLAPILMAFAGGAGWLLPLFSNRQFIDRADTPNGFPMMPEAFTFHSAFIFPLFIASVALLPLIYLWTLRAQENGQTKLMIGAGVAALLLANIHTYDAIPLLVVMLLWAGLSAHSSARVPNGTASRPWLPPLVVVVFMVPQLLYQRLVFAGSEEFRVKALSPKPSPPLLDLVLSYGPTLLLATLGAWVLWRARHKINRGAFLLVIWAAVTLFSIYTPQSLIPFARKMIEGVHLPMCFLAAVALVWLLDRLGENRVLKQTVAGGVVLLLSLSSWQFVAWCLDNARDNNASRQAALMPPLYLPAQAVETFDFLDKLPDPRNKAVLCFPLWGNYVPRFTGFPVYAGHFDETLHFPRKLTEMRRFYNGSMSTAEQLAWLRANRIGYVLVGPYERQVLGARDLPAPYQNVWSKDNLQLYKVS